ncbi:MAG: hypothetical protein MH252_08355 [Thermosynechococcaceae cyanobacterium MS004]|nr:hypothetical protein [Thermosynechococcaceae cyanobacterium MS004]
MSRLRLEIKDNRLILELECGLGAAPGLLKRLIKNQIEPLANEFCPHWLNVAEALDKALDEETAPKNLEGDPSKLAARRQLDREQLFKTHE